MADKETVLKLIEKKLIVSCQARPGWAMYGSDIMTAFAIAAQEGGAAGIRATGYDNIKAIKEKVNLPMIGINKIFDDRYEVYITPSYESAQEILQLGIEIIALDATDRTRPNGESFRSITAQIRANYPDVLIMGEISTIEEAEALIKEDVDLISTTLSGYTEASQGIENVNLELIEAISKITDIPVVAEGKIKNPQGAKAALDAGAFSVVVGTAITRPEIITQWYVAALGQD